ncbi:hypothetical protein FRY74_06390 [Vicingus serpentipes]|uniref:Uncharacterized protein n=1 Tax=Vicingus serpentipes TaxID=1926625 RepID=A0A5C6RV03_9FLAO|nr:hypothetical protein [Vicingus serpentipes]TXB66198.1 hypothetical protein FRY74_06390 [Vicingus serpentipes]
MKTETKIPKDVSIRVDYNYLVIDGKKLFDKLGYKTTAFFKGLNLHSHDSLIYFLDMGHYGISQLHDRLIDFGLVLNKDFIIDSAHSFYGVERIQHLQPKVREINFEVDWLKGAQTENGTFLWRTNRN